MNAKVLIQGMKFVAKENLICNEIKVLIAFFEEEEKTSYTFSDLAEKLKLPKTTIQGAVRGLGLRRLLVFAGKTVSGSHIYQVNPSILED